eukprot:3311845-Rhodomonas_salina.2
MVPHTLSKSNAKTCGLLPAVPAKREIALDSAAQTAREQSLRAAAGCLYGVYCWHCAAKLNPFHPPSRTIRTEHVPSGLSFRSVS